jgi:hypothetical protein
MADKLRGGIETNGRCFIVSGRGVYELFTSGNYTFIGNIDTSSGPVEFAANTTQLTLTDGNRIYVMALATNVLAPVADAPASSRIAYIDQYIVAINRNTQQFNWSKLGNASIYDPLAFASAEGAPDNLISLVVDHREVWLFGTKTTEVWVNTGSDAVFERNPSAFIEVGCVAAHSAQKLDNGIVWLGRDARGGGVVYRANGYAPSRISTRAIEEALAKPDLDLENARAYTYQFQGSSFYCLNVPGLHTTLVFDALTGQWHERAELVNGDYKAHRGVFHLYAFGRHLLGANDGTLYELDQSVSANVGDVLVRDRISPHYRSPGLKRAGFSSFEVVCDKGLGGVCQLRWSDDGGFSWGSWHQIPLGEVGERMTRARLRRLGSARDRVWQLRMTDPVSFNPVLVEIE